jgi:hypothetical protein
MKAHLAPVSPCPVRHELVHWAGTPHLAIELLWDLVYHLGHVYDKLEIRSREELRKVVLAHPRPAGSRKR